MAKHSWSKYEKVVSLALFGGTVGAAGWILDAALELTAAPVQPADMRLDTLELVRETTGRFSCDTSRPKPSRKKRGCENTYEITSPGLNDCDRKLRACQRRCGGDRHV